MIALPLPLDTAKVETKTAGLFCGGPFSLIPYGRYSGKLMLYALTAENEHVNP
ncbi:hypothetical protein [Pseudomonas syringae]|uniref:hypothetical protein n=1 Tax=Pseudomonas syringae TaxID=317 RepID=UPI003F755AC2